MTLKEMKAEAQQRNPAAFHSADQDIRERTAEALEELAAHVRAGVGRRSCELVLDALAKVRRLVG